MADNLRDITGQFKPPWYWFYDYQFQLEIKQVLYGTICFPLGQGYRCGESTEITIEEGKELTGEVGVEKGAFSGTLTIGVTTTVSQTWTPPAAGECEICLPRLCYPDSTVIISEFTGFPIPIKHIIKEVWKGPQAYFDRNCQPDPTCPGCAGKEHAGVMQTGETGTPTPSADRYACLVTPVSFPAMPGDPAEVAATMSKTLTGLWEAAMVNGQEFGSAAFGILNPSRSVTWLCPTPAMARTRISLLSRDASHFVAGGLPSRIDDPIFPVVAVTPAVEGAAATARMILQNRAEGTKVVTAPVSTATGVGTVMAASFDLSAEDLVSGGRALLQLEVGSGSPCSRNVFSEERYFGKKRAV